MTIRANQRLEQGAATRKLLVGAACALFAEKGFHGAGTNDLVAAAGVTRGALYHHFRDKEALFEAVFRDVAAELFRQASLMVAPLGADRLRRLQEGLQAHLTVIAASPKMQRILLLDGPAVLGWSRWREVQSAFSLGALVGALTELSSTGVISAGPPLLVAHLILAALNEAALLIAHAADPTLVRDEASDVLRRFVAGLR